MMPNLKPTLVPFRCEGLIDLQTQTVVFPHVHCPDDPTLESRIAEILQAKDTEPDFDWKHERDIKKLTNFACRTGLTEDAREGIEDRIRFLRQVDENRRSLDKTILQRGPKPVTGPREFRQDMIRIFGSEEALEAYIDELGKVREDRQMDLLLFG